MTESGVWDAGSLVGTALGRYALERLIGQGEQPNDDLLVASVLRESEPAVFAVLSNHVHSLTKLRDQGTSRCRRVKAARLINMLQLVVAKRLEEAGNDWSVRLPPVLSEIWNLLGIRANVGDCEKQRLSATLTQAIPQDLRVQRESFTYAS